MVLSKPRYPRYAIDLSHPAIRYAIAAAMPLLFQITAHVWYLVGLSSNLLCGPQSSF